MKRLVVEIGAGVDQHGQDPTRAAVKAVKDATARVCLVGLKEVIGLEDLDDMVVEILVAVPNPERVRAEEVMGAIPFGRKSLRAVNGGMIAKGIKMLELADQSDDILVANASVTVMLEERVHGR
ncbi:MAG: Lin0512 family protein [Ignavibacteriales bacterium]